MASATALSELYPARLQEAVRRAVLLHPGTASTPAPVDSSTLAALRKRVADAHGSHERLEALALELNARELRGLVSGLIDWEDLRISVARLLQARAKALLLPLLWKVWQRHPVSIPELQALLLSFGRTFGWSEVAGSYADVVPRWVAADEPGIAIQAWLDGLGLSFSDLESLSASPLVPDTLLFRLIRIAVMTHGSATQLRAEGPERLYAWSKPSDQLDEASRRAFHRNYLVQLSPDEWSRPIVEHIEEKYGLPKRPKSEGLPFWKTVPESVQKAFQRLFNQLVIGTIFTNDLYRREYWERWAETMEYAQRGEVSGTEYGVLDFGTFGVVEFFENGNAAYFYPQQQLQRIQKRIITSKADLRERLHPVFDYPRDNRLIHNPPPRGWFYRADSMVRTWIRGTAK